MDPMDENYTGKAISYQQKRMLLQALDAFTRSESWDAAKQVVIEHRELLSEEADAILAALIARQKDKRAIEILQDHRRVLARCRLEGVDAAFADRIAGESLAPADMDPVLWMRLQTADSYDTLLRLLFEYPELLDLVKRRMTQVLGEAQMRVINAIEIFLAADSWDAARLAVETYPELLSLDADIWLGQYASFVATRGDWNIVEILAERRWLLARCRMAGVDATFRGRNSPGDGTRLDMAPEMMARLLSA
ncbi:MAG TPA: hypothetical protein PKH77_05890 [Anaerolineae bacterium]|nr:hypothetical protein [Anaerolineae bacterium]